MDAETINAIRTLLQEYSSKQSGTVTAAYLTVGGMLGVAILGAITQWIVTKRIINAEHKRLENQLRSEFQLRRHESWETKFQEAITELLRVTDPEINPDISPRDVTPHIIRAQLLLNPRHPRHKEVNKLINELGLTVNGWLSVRDPLPILKLHGQLLDAAREIVYLPKE